jgi:tetratricopeptide (TPR) repeat protein
MTARRPLTWAAFAICVYGQLKAESADVRGLIEQGNAALAQNRLREAAAAFQKAVDLDPSSAKAHEQLGVALSREILSGNIRPSADSDVVERAESHLRRAIELTPYASAPLLTLSELEGAVAERSGDADQRAEHYKNAQDLLKQVLALEPAKAGMYFQLASLQRDEFGPAIQQAKARSSTKPGPLPDIDLRRSLQQQYGSLIDDAIQNAQKAAEMAAHSPKPLLLMSRLLRERALLRDTAEQYAADMHSADDWQRQFLTAGGHLDGASTK